MSATQHVLNSVGLPHSMKHNSWEASIHSVSQQIPITVFTKAYHWTLILPPRPISPKWSLPY